MKRIADFIVRRSKPVLIAVLLIAAVCGLLSSTVEINTDMTKYLPDDANMQQGLALMKAWFDGGEKSSIRVVFDDLGADEIDGIKERLEGIAYVSSVMHERESIDYNKDDHTLFVVNSKYDYDTDEELYIEKSISEEFEGYDMAFSNNAVKSTGVTFALLASALLMLLAILFIMSKSWLEPLLFMATTGVAVVINLGTNAIFPYTAELTASIAPILQLALSMDYSIMLMNRYREEKLSCADNADAMKAALANSFASIASSSVTTVVGLLALVFLTFKLGPELGIVLAKGVFISMLCVFTMLPVLILRFDKAIQRSEKRSPHFHMAGIARLSYASRYAIGAVFAALFIFFYIWQSKTSITFSETVPDPLADTFPKANTLVLLYNSADEANTEGIISAAEGDAHVKSVTGYVNTVGKARDAADMAEAIAELDDESDIDESMLRMLYYLYNNDKMPSIKAGDFLRFISDDVLKSASLSEYVDDSMKENADSLDRFSSRDVLISAVDTMGMANLFELDAEDVMDLYLYYYTENGGVDSGTMRVSTFADYIVNRVATDDEYSSMLDDDTSSELETMQFYTDKDAMTHPRCYWDSALALEMEAEEAKLIYAHYYLGEGGYSPSPLRLDEFVDFMINDVARNDMFSDSVKDEDIQELKQLQTFMDEDALTAQLTASELSGTLGIDEAQASMICTLYKANDESFVPKGMTLAQFVSFLLSDVADAPAFAPYFDESVMAGLESLAAYTDADAMQQPLPPGALAQMLGIDEASMRVVYAMYKSHDESYEPKGMTLADFAAFMKASVLSVPAFAPFVDDPTRQSIDALLPFTDRDALLVSRTPAELAAFLGVDEAVFRLPAEPPDETPDDTPDDTPDNTPDDTPDDTPAMSIADAVNYMLSDETIGAMLDGASCARLESLKAIIDTVLADETLGAAELSQALGAGDASMIRLVLALNDVDSVAMSPQQAVAFIVSSESLMAGLDADARAQLQALNIIIEAVTSDAVLSHAELAQILGMDATIIKAMLILPYADSCTLCIEQAVSFMLSSVDIRTSLTGESLEQLERLQTVITYVLEDTALSAADVARFAGMRTGDAKLLLTYRDAQNGEFEDSHPLSIQQIINYIAHNSGVFGAQLGDRMDDITKAQKLINAAVGNKRYSAAGLAKLLDMDGGKLEDLFLLYTRENGDTSSWKLSPQAFIAFTVDTVLPDDAYSDRFDADSTSDLLSGRRLIDAVVSALEYDPAAMCDLLSGFSGEATQNDVELLYLYYAGQNHYDPRWRMTIPELFDYICDTVLFDARFSSAFDDEERSELLSRKGDLDEGIAQMKGESYSRLIIETDYPDESDETSAFMANIDSLRTHRLEHDSYMIGTSAMVYEMEQSFSREYALISMITAVAIFLVVLLAFKNAFVPALLTAVVQCGVFITVTVVRWQGNSIYYLALLIVQSILMGATIDYGIVFCSYYRENRATLGKLESLKASFEASIHTIMTSGSILVLVTAVLGLFSPDAITSQVCITISIGSLVAVLLILFVLPGTLVAFDRLAVKRPR